MARLFFKKMPGGYLAPADDEAAEWLQKIKTGDAVAGDFVRPRNYKFHAKLICLYRLAYDYFADNLDGGLQYKGQKCTPSFDRFRRDLTILAGHYTATYGIMGDVRLEAKSISFANCSEEEAERIFSDVINASLKQVFKMSVSEDELRTMVDNILHFA